MDEFKSAMMKDIGPGGIRCPCCNLTFTKKHYNQTLLRKRARSRLKQEDKHILSRNEARPELG